MKMRQEMDKKKSHFFMQSRPSAVAKNPKKGRKLDPCPVQKISGLYTHING
jgi:hypothetical protein